ncbi:MAG: hypothetical protein ACFFDN_00865 [Candidatus Hodarchaeota archaeon]
MPKIPFDIIGGYEKTKNVVNAQETVNWYVDNTSEGAYLCPTAGLSVATSFLLGGIGRALYQYRDKADDKLYAVIGQHLFALTYSLSQVFLGQIETGSGFIDIDDDGKNLILVDGADGWLYDKEVSVFKKITFPNFPTNPTAVTFFGNRFLVSTDTDNLITPSEILDPYNWDNAARFGLPANEKVISHATLNGRLFVFGKTITQIWQDAGLPVEPFQKEPTDLNFGCAARGSIAKEEGVLIWLTQDREGIGAFVLSTGGVPVNITSAAIADRLANYDDVSDVRAYIYRNELGHIFYRVNFTDANESWQFRINDKVNSVEKRWIKLESGNKDRHLGETHTYFNRKHYVLGYNNNKLYEMSIKFGDDDGIAIRRARITSNLVLPTLERFKLNQIIIDLNSGASFDNFIPTELAPATKDGKIFLSISRDGGLSYGTSLHKPIGKIGEVKTTVRFTRFGESKKFTFKIETYNRIPIFLLKAAIDISPLQRTA